MTVNPASVDVRDHLIDQNVVNGDVSPVTGDWECYAGFLPDKPDKCVSVVDTSGEEPEARFAYESPRVSIRVRGERGGWRATHDKAIEVYEALHARSIGGEYPLAVALQSPMQMAIDPDDQPIWSFNLRLVRTR